MIREEFFPTSVFGKDVKLDNNKLAQDIANWSNQDPGVAKTNYKGWHSTTDMASKPEYQLLVNELMTMCKDIFKEEWLTREPILGNMWANINPKEGMNHPHIHPNALFSGVCSTCVCVYMLCGMLPDVTPCCLGLYLSKGLVFTPLARGEPGGPTTTNKVRCYPPPQQSCPQT